MSNENVDIGGSQHAVHVFVVADAAVHFSYTGVPGTLSHQYTDVEGHAEFVCGTPPSHGTWGSSFEVNRSGRTRQRMERNIRSKVPASDRRRRSPYPRQSVLTTSVS